PREPPMRPMRPDRATLIYDGECGFCRQAADLVRRWDREQRIALVPFQDQARVAAFGIPLPALAAAMHLVLPAPDGRVFAGADAVRQALRQVKDPELDMNIIDLGLVYDVEIAGGDVRVNMTLTSPGCPAGPMITNDAYRVLRALGGVKDVDIEIVWEPYWTPERMDPKVRALMGL